MAAKVVQARPTVDASAEYARDLTDRIRKSAEGLYALLLEAWESEAWRHLGYRSWNQYIAGEFDFSRQRAYQLVNQGAVIREIRSGVSTSVDTSDEIHITEAEARDIAPMLPQVIGQARDQIAAGEPAQQAVQNAVVAVRTKTQPTDNAVACQHEYVCRLCGVADRGGA